MVLNRNEVLISADNIVVPCTTLKRTLFGPRSARAEQRANKAGRKAVTVLGAKKNYYLLCVIIVALIPAPPRLPFIKTVYIFPASKVTLDSPLPTIGITA